MTVYLLDANVLIALTAREHVHHGRASIWMEGVERFATCSVVEGALVRFAIRLGATSGEAQELLRMVHEHPRFEFFSDSISYCDVDLSHVHGHRQVTDAYLAALARAHPDTRLASLDEALVSAASDVVVLV